MNRKRQNEIDQTKVRPEVAKLIKEISKKYDRVWRDLAKV